MSTSIKQFQFSILKNHFESDPHEQIKGLDIARFHILKGTKTNSDITVVEYKNSPLLSFYDVNGRLIDVDHYLPDNYINYDDLGIQSVINNLKNYDSVYAAKKSSFKHILSEIYETGNGDFVSGLFDVYGLSLDSRALALTLNKEAIDVENKDYSALIQNKFLSFAEFLDELVVNYQKASNGYVHVTHNGNIIITPLNKRSGMSVILETKNIEGELLFPNKWNIVRTTTQVQLDQALVFRTEDVKAFFDATNFETIVDTDRYRLYHKPGELNIDSLLDNTDNLLRMRCTHDCYQILASDKNIIVVLSNDQEITIINTHKSVVPQKWPRKIVLPEDVVWMTVDENLTAVFVQTKDGEISIYDITSDHPSLLNRVGKYDIGFDVDQRGDIVVSSDDGLQLHKIKTNIYDLNLGADSSTFTAVFQDISHLFKGDSLFTNVKYAKLVSEVVQEEKDILPTAIESAKYDFEASVDYLLMNAGDSYDKLLDVKNKVAIARQNISEEIFKKAESSGVILVGKRLKKSITNIVGPTEKKINRMVNRARAEIIIADVQEYKKNISGQENTEQYREMLNTIRQYDEELRYIADDIDNEIISEFNGVKLAMNSLFADQITQDSNKLNQFIKGEIEHIESAINETHDVRQLELLLSTHPACLELMSLLKEPYVLQSVATSNKFSPVMIQNRLYKAIDKRRGILLQAIAKKEAEREAAKIQYSEMIRTSIDFFVKNHTGGFSDQELASNASHETIQRDIRNLEREYDDIRLSQELRRRLTRRILERNRKDLEKLLAYEGRYAYVQNDPDLYVEYQVGNVKLPKWQLNIKEKKDQPGVYSIYFLRSSDKSVHNISTEENLLSNKAFEIQEVNYKSFQEKYQFFLSGEHDYIMLNALWSIHSGTSKKADYPQFTDVSLNSALPSDDVAAKALRCALEKKKKDYEEANRDRNVPKISGDFIDETPFFQDKLNEFVIKAKLQMMSGSGIILLSGPPSTGKSVFLKFAASIMNREYFEHTSDKWQTKNSLVTAIKFGEYGPYSIPAGFTKAITTPHSLINIEEIKEWPEALRKSLNPFFAGSKIFTGPDGTRYDIGENILLCAAANLGSMYRQDDEPFTADFWSRIEVVEYNYSPQKVDNEYYQGLINPKKKKLVTLQDLVKDRFDYYNAPASTEERASFYAKQFLEFTLLPKADVTIQEFFDLYDHFANNTNLRGKRLIKMKTADVEKYEQLKIITLMLVKIEGCLRMLREVFYASAGQTEIEGTNREFIKCVYLMRLMGRL